MLSRTLGSAGSRSSQRPARLCAGDRYTRFSGIEVRVVPENVTNAPKTPIAASREPLVEDKLLIAKRGENFEQVMRGAGAAPDQIRAMIQAFGGKVRVCRPAGRPGPAGPLCAGPAPGRCPPDRPRFASDQWPARRHGRDQRQGRVRRRSTCPSRTWSVRSAAAEARTTRREDEERAAAAAPASTRASTRPALRTTCRARLIDELVRIFSYDLDFQQRVARRRQSRGDLHRGRRRRARPEILSAALTDRRRDAARLPLPGAEDGLIEYFDEDGRSLKKFLLRKPIADGDHALRLRHRATTRSSAIRRCIPASTGPTASARRSSRPATAPCIKAEWASGYGRRIEIQHANGYVTTYSHQSRFAKGIGPGAKVRQGQVIGYLGNHRPLDRPAPALRGRGQRPLRRPDEDPRAARTRARRPRARRVQAPARRRSRA